MSETALLLLATADAAGHVESIRKRVEAVSRSLVPYARGPRAAAGVCLDPASARSYAMAHGCLSRLGYPDPEFDRLLSQALRSTAAARERIPHRQLEQEWLRRVWDPSPGTPAPRPGTASRSMLGVPLDALSANADEIYAFTHALMYVTDIGARRPRLPRSGAAIAADAEAALAYCLDEQDYDLAAEVLLTWPLLRRRWSAASMFGLRVLMRVEDEAGFLPAPTIRLDRYGALSGDERTRYALAMTYHTAYVMGLLCAAALRPRCGPPAEIPIGGSTPRSANLLPGLLNGDAGRPHWTERFTELSSAEQDALASLLLTVALRRSVARRDLTEVRALLDAAAGNDLASTPVARQAVELLRRARTMPASRQAISSAYSRPVAARSASSRSGRLKR